MAYLANELRSKKLIDIEVEVSDFLKQNNITKNAMIYQMNFDKKVFKDEFEVREWLKYNYYYFDDIIEVEGNFVVKPLSTSQLNLATAVEVKLRRGLTVNAADLFMQSNGEYLFSAKEDFVGTDFIELKSDGSLPQVIEVARIIKGEHPTFGEINITKETLDSFIVNFENKVVGIDLAINEDHLKNEAFGWFKDLFLSEDGNKLLATIKWNTKGTKALSDGEYRYFSPEFRLNFKHPHTGKEYGPTLMGGALTNYPFLKMDAITALNEKTQTKETKVEKTIELKVHEDKIMELSNKNQEISLKLQESEGKVVELSNKITKMEADANKAARESANQKLFDAGKINAAQLVALNEGKSAFDVIALSAPMSTKEIGKDGGGKVITLSEDEKKVAASLNLTDEEYLAGK